MTEPPRTPADAQSPFDLIRHWAQTDHPFASYELPDGSRLDVSYAEQLDRSMRTAGVLAKNGVSTGDRVHVHLPNGPQFLDVWCGADAIGAIIVPTNPLASSGELEHFLGDSGAVVSVVADDLVDVVRAALPDDVVLISSSELESARPTTSPAEPVAQDRSALAAILYTSGTTSLPKGVMVTNANYLAVGRACAEHYRVTQEDRWLIVLPFFHGNAQYYCTMSALVAGASIAVMSSFSASNWGRQAREYGATLASLFGAPIRMILAQPENDDDADNALRTVMFAQGVSSSQYADFERRFGTMLIHGYGMTETVIPPTLNPLSDDRRPDSMGNALPGMRLRIVGEDGTDVAPGEPGDLLVYGEMGEGIAAGYWQRPDATAETFAGNWLHTGDVVRLDPDGFYYFVDRSKDMIKRAGENVAAAEVEAVINEHPAVFESAAVGAPDEMRDEMIVVYVVLNSGAQFDADDLTAWSRERLSKFRVPSRFIEADELPRTSVGKIRKNVLRDELRGDSTSS
ncbi:AMP-binding protein [Epidermidibacterium keratini]|uniref:AMP-binding protein n=1 Tax=Epidermidibacterium keratini TaxID=1891644 RepID=A0A7L4YMJ8_9ACTN|nr:AMP-binding protein [Epidermidibacterium keratini]QHC00308.1 AMP-binding protein [Epidermidibacterium keratini]